MNWTDLRTNWNRYEQQIHSKWSKLSNEDLKAIGGNRDELVKRLQKAYTLDRKKAEDEAEAFVRTLH